MITADDILNKAASYIGTKERPANSNNVIFNTHYYGQAVRGAAYPWCCSFVWDIFRMCNAGRLFCDGSKTAYCPAVESWARNKKIWHANTKGKKGDLCLMDFGKGRASHIGIVERKNPDGSYTVIEGNTSVSSNDNGGSVMRRTRYARNIRGFARPGYEEPASASYTHRTFVKEVQSAVGAKTDGIAGAETLSKTVTISRSKNSRHAAVKPIQKYFNSIGYDCGEADCIAGARFDAAVKAFQRANGCIVDGEITAGKTTWKKLLKMI